MRQRYCITSGFIVQQGQQNRTAAPILRKVPPRTLRLATTHERHAAGFSMSEMLVVVLLLGLMTTLVSGVMSSIIGSYKKMQIYANAETLCNTVLTRIVTELRGSTDVQEITVEKTDTIIFVSHSGTKYDNQRIGFPMDTTDNAGQVQVTTYTNQLSKQQNPVDLLSSSLYTDDMTVGVEFTTTNKSKLISVEVKVYYDGDELIEESQSVAVESFLDTTT